jgi:hypothetical protein
MHNNIVLTHSHTTGHSHPLTFFCERYLQVESVTTLVSTPEVVQGETESFLRKPHHSADASDESFQLAGFSHAAMPGISQKASLQV